MGAARHGSDTLCDSSIKHVREGGKIALSSGLVRRNDAFCHSGAQAGCWRSFARTVTETCGQVGLGVWLMEGGRKGRVISWTVDVGCGHGGSRSLLATGRRLATWRAVAATATATAASAIRCHAAVAMAVAVAVAVAGQFCQLHSFGRVPV